MSSTTRKCHNCGQGTTGDHCNWCGHPLIEGRSTRKFYLVIALVLALVLSGGLYAYTYTTASGTIGATGAEGDLATAEPVSEADQPNWNSVLPSGETEILRPNAAGTYTQLTPIGDTSNYLCVDEEVADDDTTYISVTGVDEKYDTYSISNHSVGTGDISSVTVYVRCRSSDSNGQWAKPMVRTYDTDYYGDQTPLPESYTNLSTTWITNPSTGETWTWDEIDALEAGVRMYGGGNDGDSRCTQVYVQVGYTVVCGEVPTGDLYEVTPNSSYTGDLQAKVYLTNTAALTKAYQYLNMKLYVEDSAEADETPNYQLLTLVNGVTTFNLRNIGGGSSGTWAQTSQADFEGGNPSQIETTTSPGDVKVDTTSDTVTDTFADETKIASKSNLVVTGGQVKLTGGDSGNWTQTTQTDFEAGVTNNVDTSSAPGDVKLAVELGGDYVYAFRGYNSKDFWRYDVAGNSWTALAVAPGTVHYGGDLAHDGDNYIYATRGDDSKDFWRYDIAANSWTALTSTPANVKEGGDLAYNSNNYIYALQGKTSKDFWRYDIAANSWTVLASTPAAVKQGGSLAYDGNNYIYAMEGNDLTGFWRYDIAANSWTALTSTPGTVKEGGDLAYDGDSYVYALRGDGATDFWRYDITANSWTAMAITPAVVKQGGDLTYDGDNYIYAFEGKALTCFWRYDIAANSWTAMANAPNLVKEGGSLEMKSGGDYITSGTQASQVLDTGVVGATWSQLSWSETLQANTDITFQVRASDTSFLKGAATPSWSSVGGTSPVTTELPAGRYKQWQATLTTSDTAKTPTLHEIVVDYSGSYNSPGDFMSTNLLSGETLTSIDSFGYNASAIPSGTSLKVQFSQDNTNWCNSAGTADGWDTLSQGTDIIDLSSLGWSGANFYYKMEFTSDGTDTPVLDEISVTYSSYYTSGTLTSSAYDAGHEMDWSTISFTIDEPSGTEIKFQIRTAATEDGLSSATWYGPTGTDDYYTSTGTAINSVHYRDRWVQYKAYFTGPGDSTPTLSDVSIAYTTEGVPYTVEVIGGSYCLTSGDSSEWAEGWSVTPEFYCEVTQR